MTTKGNVLAASVIVAGSLVFASVAQANQQMSSWADNTYFGFDYVRASIDFDKSGGIDYNNIYKDEFSALNPYLGYRFNDSWSAELGYIESNDRSKTVSTNTTDSVSITGSTKAELRSWHLDGVYNYDFADDFSLLGSVGVERSHFKTTTNLTTTATVKASERELAMRVGLGFGFRFNDELSARVMARYANTGFEDIASNTMYYSVGLAYDF